MATSIKPNMDTNNPAGHKYFDVTIFGRARVFTTLTTDPEFANSWIRQSVESSKHDKLVVGLNIELVNPGPNPATIQLCIDGQCLVYRIVQSTMSLPRGVEQFITNPNNIFVGVGLEYKLAVLKYKTKFSGSVPYANLGHLASFHCNKPKLLDAEMSELALNVLGEKLVMPQVDPNWDRDELLDVQVMYACVRAYVSYELGTVIVGM